MPTASSTRSARVTRSDRMNAKARPVATSVGSARIPAVSLMTGLATTEVSVIAGLPGTDEQSRQSSAPAVARPETSQADAIAELAVNRDGEDITPQDPQQSANTLPFGEAFADLFGFVQTMSEELNLLCAEVITLKAKELAYNDIIDGLRYPILDLEEIIDPARSRGRRPCPGERFKKCT
jgi:antirestriction protein ArdC